MAGLVPAIHVFSLSGEEKAWMPGTRPGMTGFATKPYFFGCILSQAPQDEGIKRLRRSGASSPKMI
jgi:hypothetical protein